MTLAQFVFDAIIHFPARFGSRTRPMANVVSTLAMQLSRRLLGDATVTYVLNGHRLGMPLSHALPLIRLRHPGYSENIGRVAAAFRQKYPDLAMVDIGANVGDTVAMVRKTVSIPMLCIDGDSRFFELLASNSKSWPDVEIEQAFVGAQTGVVAGRLHASHGSGHLVKDDVSSIATESLEMILARHPRFRSAKLVKIDTDGLDTYIIKGAIRTLESLKAAIFFEYDPHFFACHDPSGFDVFATLRANGYESALFYENTGEFLINVSLGDHAKLEDLHAFCSGRRGKRYFDVCVAHSEDTDVLQDIRAAEIAEAEARPQ